MDASLDRQASPDELAGIAWWNAQTEAQRLHWCLVARTGVPAGAWMARKLVGHVLDLAELARAGEVRARQQIRFAGEAAAFSGGQEGLSHLRAAVQGAAPATSVGNGGWLDELLADCWKDIPAADLAAFSHR